VDDILILFGKRYSRFLRLLELVAVYLPHRLRWPLADFVCRFTNPYNRSAADITASISRALSLDTRVAHRAWLRWRASHARFVLTAFQYGKIDSAWIRRFVQVQNPGLLEQIIQTGGLILTYHTHHQNTLATVLGVAGSTISPVAASAAESPLYRVIGRYIDLINTGSQQQFRGGSYLYTDNLRRVLQQARTKLRHGELLLSLCDFHQPSSEQPYDFLGRAITPPTGIIRLALQCEVPIYYGLLFPDSDGRFQLLLAGAKGCDLHTVTEEYLAFLEQIVQRAPEAWQGWEWYDCLPEAVAVKEDIMP
jgi:lauroyl/myristoyl acyltransferase